MMNRFRSICLVLVAAALLVALPVANAGIDRRSTSALPASAWWLVTHDQCADTLHWINPSGEFATIPRPKLPNEAPAVACSAKALHISQNGRFLAEIAPLNDGRVGVGFYDLQTAAWLHVHEAEVNEAAYLGGRYSSDVHNWIAISFANQGIAPHGWRVIIFDMTTGNEVDELRSDGSEIASFVGGEFLATAATIPYVVLMAQDQATSSNQVHIRFDGMNPGDAPLGAAAWYPAGVPGVGQELVSSPYSEADSAVLPNGHAVYAYSDPAYPAGPPAGEGLVPITTNAIALMLPDALGPTADPQLYFADGVSTLYDTAWGADGQIVLFRRADSGGSMMYWIKLGTAVLTPLAQAAQVIDVPTGFIYSTSDSIYFLNVASTAPTGPIVTDPALSGHMAFVWATPFGNPPLALDSLGTSVLPIATPSGPGVIIVTATPDTGVCRLTSADGTNINVRSGPGTNYPIIGQMNGSTELDVIGVNGQWYVVNFSGVQGWMAGWVTTLKGNCTGLAYVAAPPPPAPTAVPPPPAGAVIQFGADRTNITAGECVNISWHVENINQVYYGSEGVTGDGSRTECPAATTTYTLTVLLNDGTTQTRTVTITVGGGGGGGQPDLFVSEFSLDPSTPVQGQPVNVRVGVYNQGSAAATGTFHIEWYPGENYSTPACTWDLDGLVASGGRILTCTYAGYPSWYGSINTKVVVDSYNAIAESNEGNNTYLQPISVSQSGGGQPDLYVSEFHLNPSTPVQGQPVQVSVGVYNGGNAAVSGTSFHVEWYAGENYPSPACSWDLNSVPAHGGYVKTCTYAGYPSWYGSINTKVIVDTGNTVAESNEGNNTYVQGISVAKP
jgi:hypothetical protein